MAVKHTTPDEAYQIAAHSMACLRSIRECKTSTDLKSQTADWFRWASANGVCDAIKAHFRLVEREMSARVKHDKAPERDIRNPAGADA